MEERARLHTLNPPTVFQRLTSNLKPTRRWIAAAMLCGAFAFAACGSDDDDQGQSANETARANTTQPAAQPTIDGSVANSDGNEPGIPELDGEVVETPSGLKYIDERAGDGDTPEQTQCVTVHYTGWTLDGNKFDSSVDRGSAIAFPLNGVIAGWTEGVGTMQENGKRRLIIPGDLGYRAGGNPDAGIAPNATLIFDVELIEVGGEPTQGARGPECPQP